MGQYRKEGGWAVLTEHRANERVHHPSSLAPFPAPFYYFTKLIYLTALSKSQPKLQFLPVKRRSCRRFHTHVHKTLHTNLKTKAKKTKTPNHQLLPGQSV